ncbi:HotDog domain-containing protein [Aspergillus cavernicola]|uniref:HotDog domain-containing protein n=1 Tax=Aspergillus cavernicola TaxID=176166 RepID=A0ABR4IJR5_9EURO
MSSNTRTLSRLLRRQTRTQAATIATPTTIQTCRTPLRSAQTQAAPSTLKNTPPPPPPAGHSFQHAHHRKPTSTSTSKPKSNNSDSDSDILSTHPILQSLRQDPSLKESRPHLSMPQSLRPSHFVAGSLAGEGKLTVPPYMFLSRRQGKESTNEPLNQSHAIAVLHIGTQMCGHPGFVHGGLLSVLFDEVFAHCVSQSFPSGTGMTANLNVDFRKPALPGRVFVLRAETVKVEGRKAWVEGRMSMMSPSLGGKGEGEGEGQEGVMVAEARALFVEPRFAESMVSVYRN